jgi:ATP-binding cassette, subfamily B, bacterial
MTRPQTLKESLPGMRRVVWHFWPYVRRQSRMVGASALALFAGVGLRLLEPWPLKVVFDRVLGAERHANLAGVPFLDALEPMTLLALAALAVVVIAGLRALADYGYTVGFALASNRALTEVRSDVYRHLQGLSLAFHTRAKSGDLIVRVIGDIGMLRDATTTAALPLLASLLILTGMVGVMFSMHWQLTLLVLAVAPLFWLSTVRVGRRLHEVARTQRQREGAMAATAAESIGAIQVVQALSLEGRFAEAFSGDNHARA